MLDLPAKIRVKDGDEIHENVEMWHYYCLQEGTLGVDPNMLKTNDGKMPPVIHVDTDAPLYSDIDGRLITDKMWGIYYKPDFSFDGVQGGAAPYMWTQQMMISVLIPMVLNLRTLWSAKTLLTCGVPP